MLNPRAWERYRSDPRLHAAARVVRRRPAATVAVWLAVLEIAVERRGELVPDLAPRVALLSGETVKTVALVLGQLRGWRMIDGDRVPEWRRSAAPVPVLERVRAHRRRRKEVLTESAAAIAPAPVTIANPMIQHETRQGDPLHAGGGTIDTGQNPIPDGATAPLTTANSLIYNETHPIDSLHAIDGTSSPPVSAKMGETAPVASANSLQRKESAMPAPLHANADRGTETHTDQDPIKSLAGMRGTVLGPNKSNGRFVGAVKPVQQSLALVTPRQRSLTAPTPTVIARARDSQTQNHESEIQESACEYIQNHTGESESGWGVWGGRDFRPDPRTADPPAQDHGRRASRLPADWQPSHDDWRFAAERGMDDAKIRDSVGAFVDYWHAEAGARSRKLDWSATWRNWVRREMQRFSGRNSRPVTPPPRGAAPPLSDKRAFLDHALDAAMEFDPSLREYVEKHGRGD